MREPCKVSEVLAGTCFVGSPVGALLGLTIQLSRDVHFCFRTANHCTPDYRLSSFSGLRRFTGACGSVGGRDSMAWLTAGKPAQVMNKSRPTLIACTMQRGMIDRRSCRLRQVQCRLRSAGRMGGH